MKRKIVASSALLFVLVLAFGIPMPGGVSATSKSQESANAAQCEKVAKGHSR